MRRWPAAPVLALLPVLMLAAASGLATSGTGCSDGPREVREERRPDYPPPTFRLAVVTDLQGTLEPCGCTSRPLGGIDRMAAALGALREDGPPVLFVAAGDLLFGPGGHGAADEAGAQQEIWKAETLMEILGRLELAAAAPGRLDTSHGVATLADLTASAPFPFLAPGLALGPASAATDAATDSATDPDAGSGTGTKPPTPWRHGLVREVGGVKVGLLGISEMEGPAGELPDGITRTMPAAEAAQATAAQLRAEGAEVLVALVNGTRRSAREIARRVEGLDFVVQGGISEADPIPPTRVGDSLLLHAGRQGQGVLVVDVYRRGEGAGWRDAGRWARELERTRLEERAAELERKIREWERDPEVTKEDIAAQRARLAEMRREAEGPGGPEPLPEGNVVLAEWRELDPEAPRDPTTAQVLERYFKRVNAYNRRVFADLEPPPAPEGEPHYIGSEACATCHRPAYDWWKGTLHGQAYATLVERHKQFNLDCVGCHVTGYHEPGGSTVTHVDSLKNVGCEQCHGPGSEHVKNPAPPHSVRREVPESVCVGCHNAEHSDLFHYESYRRVLMMPGHGKPLEDD